jgi:hypothetical protein
VLRILLRGGTRFWLRAAASGAAVALVIGMPTVLIENSFFRRMTPTSPWQYVAWMAGALLSGMVLSASHLPGASCRPGGRALAGGGLTYLAVGCPICNKVVVALLGVSGALHYFAPIQPLLGVLGIAVLLLTLRAAIHTIALGSPPLPKQNAALPRPPLERSRAPSSGRWE